MVAAPFVAAPLVATSLVACGNKSSQSSSQTNAAPKQSAPADARVVHLPQRNPAMNRCVSPIPAHLWSDMRTLEDYLKTQKVVDVRKVDRIYLTEVTLLDPERHGIPPVPGLMKKLREKKMAAFTMFPLTFDPQQLTRGNRLNLYKLPTIVLIPRQLLAWAKGSAVQRRSFDSVMYHEVMGHGVDFLPNSKMMTFVKRLLSYMTLTPKGMQEMMNILEDVKEFSAYVVEVDRLITKFDYDKKPSVVNAISRQRIENNISIYTMTILQLLRMKGKHAGLDLFIKDLEKFTMWRIGTVTPRTRAYVRKILRANKWTYAIPF